MFSQAAHQVVITYQYGVLRVYSVDDRSLLLSLRLYRALEALGDLHQVDIIDGFLNELVINCVDFCITDCVFTGGSA